MGLTKPIEQVFIKLLRYIYVSKRYYTRRDWNEMECDRVIDCNSGHDINYNSYRTSGQKVRKQKTVTEHEK